MSDTTNDTKPPSKRQQRQAVDAVKIYTTDPSKADLAYIAREFILCTLPHSDPGDALFWGRTNGNLTLGIKAGIDEKTGKSYGIPYGIIPRLILVWMVTEIVRTKSRRLELGNRLSDFLLTLGLDPSRGGKRSDARRVPQQMEKLFNSTMSFGASFKGEGRSGYARENIQVAPLAVFWWSDKDPEQAALFGSYIEVSEGFFKAVTKAPHPLDVRVLRHIKDSSLGIDLYTILNREAFRAMKDGKPYFLAWEWLHEQTGNEYKRLCDFRRDALVQVEAIIAVHSGLIITQQKPARGRKSGLVISNLSTPSIVPREAARAHVQSDPNRQPTALALVPPPEPPAPPPERFLKPATVARFHGMYPRLDPYACKADFDAWAEGLPPEKKPRHYDAAFKGFAEKWVVGKLIVSNP
jgi:hypothetical protein